MHVYTNVGAKTQMGDRAHTPVRSQGGWKVVKSRFHRYLEIFLFRNSSADPVQATVSQTHDLHKALVLTIVSS